MRTWLCSIVMALALGGCSDVPDEIIPDARTVAPTPDAQIIDAAPPADAGADAGPDAALPVDARVNDAQVSDGRVNDAM